MEQSTKREIEQAKSMSSYSWRERQKGVTRPGPEPVREKKKQHTKKITPRIRETHGAFRGGKQDE